MYQLAYKVGLDSEQESPLALPFLVKEGLGVLAAVVAVRATKVY